MAKNNDNNEIVLDITVKYEDAIKNIVKYRKEIDDLKKTNKELEKDNKENNKQNKERTAAYKKGRASVSEFTGDTKKSSKSIAENTAQVEANNIEIQRKSAAVRVLQNEIKDNLKIEAEQKNSINAITTELRLLNREYEKLGEGTERDALGAKIKLLQSDLNELNEARGRFQGQVGNYENAIKSALGFNNQFANSLLNLGNNADKSGSKLQSFASEGSKSIQAFSKALLGLLANPVFLSIAGIAAIGVSFKFWYDYNKGLVEATRLTKQFTGLAGKDLKDFRNEVQAISDTFDKDFKDTLVATNALAKQFGISQKEALSYVKDGFIAGGDVNGEYLDTLKEYAAYFKEAGLSASEFVSITANTANSGIFSDKGIDAIKEANIRIREMTTATASALDGIGIASTEVQESLQKGSTTTFEVMQKVSQKLNELPSQSQQVGTAIADIFGGAGEDAGLQYLKTLKDINTNLDSTKEKAGELGKLQESLLNANIELTNAISDLFDYTDGSFEKMDTEFKVFLTQSLTQFIKDLKSIKEWFVSIYDELVVVRGAIQLLILSFKAAWDIVEGLFKSIGSVLTYVVDILKAISTFDFSNLDASLKKMLSGIVDSFRSMLNFLWKDVLSFVAGVENLQANKLKPLTVKSTITTVRENITKNNTTNNNVDKNKELSAAKDKFNKMNKKQLEEWVNDEKNAKDQYLKVAQDILKNKEKIGVDISKANEEANKAALDLAKFRLEQSIKAEKEITDNQSKSENERLSSLQKYYNLQKSLILKEEELEIKEAGANENKKQLIREQSAAKILDLDKELINSRQKIATDQVEIEKTNIANQLATVKKGSDSELQLRLRQLEILRDQEIKNAEQTGASVADIKAKYIQQENDERKKQQDYFDQQRNLSYQNEILQAQINGQDTLALQIAQKQEELDTLASIDSQSDAEILNRKLILQNELKNLNQQLTNQTIASIQSISGSFADFFSSLADQNKEFAAVAKAAALVEIGINQAVAIAGAIKAASGVQFPANLPAIATSVAAVLSGFKQVYKIFGSSSGGGSSSNSYSGTTTTGGNGYRSTSSSISNTSRSTQSDDLTNKVGTSLVRSTLTDLKGISNGIPLNTTQSVDQTLNTNNLKNALIESIQQLPSPTVSVVDINSVQQKVSVMDNMRSL